MPETKTTTPPEGDSCRRETGIEELDDLLRGGLILPPNPGSKSRHSGSQCGKGLVIVIRGEAGTGKSTLAMQIAGNLQYAHLLSRHYPEATKPGGWKQALAPSEQGPPQSFLSLFPEGGTNDLERGVFYSLEQTPYELGHKLASLYASWLRHGMRKAKRIRTPTLAGKPINWESNHIWEDGGSTLSHLAFGMSLLGHHDIARGVGNPHCNEFETICSEWVWFGNDGVAHYSDSPRATYPFSQEDRRKRRSRRQEMEKRLLTRKLEEQHWMPLRFEPLPDSSGEEPVDSSMDQVGKLLRVLKKLDEYQEHRTPVLVLDGLSSLSRAEMDVIDTGNLVNRLRRAADVSILVYEPDEADDTRLDFRADMVIMLQATQLHQPMQYLLHELRILKARYQEAVLGWHQYKIRDWGFEVYPSIHFQVHTPNKMNDQLLDSTTSIEVLARQLQQDKRSQPSREFSGSFLEAMLGGINPGSQTVLLGARGTFKTTLSWDFLVTGHRSLGRSGLLVSLIDNPETIIGRTECPRIEGDDKLRCPSDIHDSKTCMDNIFFFHQRPGCITPAEFMQFLDRRLLLCEAREQSNFKPRLVFWDMTQIDYRFPFFSNDPLFLPALMDMLKKREISSVYIGAGNANYTRAASALADNAVFCWRDRECETAPPSPATLRSQGEHPEEYLLLHVDRAEGQLGSEGKALYVLPIDSRHGIRPPRLEEIDQRTVAVLPTTTVRSTVPQSSKSDPPARETRIRTFSYLEHDQNTALANWQSATTMSDRDASKRFVFAEESLRRITAQQGVGQI
jgi:KaiC/GvpD/RAD55 family RecA-like ATPase